MDERQSGRSPRRKRTAEDDSTDATDAKRFNNGHGSNIQPLVKILVPNYAAGAIIGKSGQNISQLQSTYGARIRLSPNNEFYPGTHERVVVITGAIDQVIDLHKYVMDKVISELQSSQNYANDKERLRQVKIVVPNATAGLVIGKGGANIRNVAEESGSKIVISSRDDEFFPGERIITVSGTPDQNEDACRLIINRIAVDPENMINKNVSYSNLASSSNHRNQYYNNNNDQNANNLNALNSVLASLASQKTSHNLLSYLGNLNNNNNNNNITNPMSSKTNKYGGGSCGGALPTCPTLPNVKTIASLIMHVPDVYVGSVLGKSGRTVNELIHQSGAKLQFSGKGEYAAGTTNRILTINGDMQSVQSAHYLVCQKLLEAEMDVQNPRMWFDFVHSMTDAAQGGVPVVEQEDFLRTGRTGRRNALGNVLDSKSSKATTAHLPDSLGGLSIASSSSGEPDKAKT